MFSRRCRSRAARNELVTMASRIFHPQYVPLSCTLFLYSGDNDLIILRVPFSSLV
jgi:hypothetical protein